MREEGELTLSRSVRDGHRVVRVCGVLNDDNAHAFGALVEAQGESDILELGELDLEGARATLAAVDAVRGRLAADGRLTLVHTPQILAHTLYRTGLLESAHLNLVETRQEEPHS